MSDGPYKSLPLRKHWKSFADMVDRGLYKDLDMRDKLTTALLEDAKKEKLPDCINQLNGLICDDNGQAKLFPLLPGQLSSLRHRFAGHLLSMDLIEKCSDAMSQNTLDANGVESELFDVLRGRQKSSCSSIVEHGMRKNEADGISHKLERIDYESGIRGAVSQLALGNGGPRNASKKHSGTDEGPLL